MATKDRQGEPVEPSDPASGTVKLPSERTPVHTREAATQVQVRKARPASELESEPPVSELSNGSEEPSGPPISAPPLSTPPPSGGGLHQRFRFGHVLGRGGMGEVQAAQDRGLLRLVAVKTWHGADTPDEVRQRFLAEARITAQLEHPNILPIYSLEQASEGQYAFVMRLIEGQTLLEYLAEVARSYESGEVGPEHRVETRIEHLLKVCDAIDYAHSRGVLHRDLKPENVMLASHGEVYVMDWGLALVMGESEETPAPESNPVSVDLASEGRRLTAVGDVLGTPEYMPPEQAMGKVDSLGPSADQYALGMILFELVTLTQARPSDGGPAEVVEAARRGEVGPIQQWYGEPIPTGLAKIIEHATQARAEDRYPSVRAFADDLRRFVRGEAPEVAPDSWPAALWRRLNRRPAMAMAVFLSVLALALGGVAVGLYNTLTERERAAREGKITSRLTGAVVRRSDALERQLDRVRLLLEGFGRSTEQLLSHGKPVAEALWVSPPSVQVIEGTTHSDRHGQVVSFDHCVKYFAEGQSGGAETTLRRLGPACPFMKRIYHRDGAHWLPPLWVYAGFESGLFINYPANGDYVDDYDPRVRPWYRGGKGVRGHHWGEPYHDITGGTLQLPATLALFDDGEDFIGMVAIDVSLEDLASKLSMADLPGWKHSYLVDDEGGIIVDTAGEQSPTVAEDDTLQLEKLPNPAVVDAIAEERALGTARRGNRRIAYHRLDVIPWYLVAEVDEDTFAESL